MTSATLSASTYQTLWDQLGLSDMPTVLHVNPSEQVAVEVDQHVIEQLKLLERPSRSIDARLHLDGPVRALAVPGLLAVLRDDQLTLTSTPPEALARAVVDLLPPVAAGPGRSVSLPSATLKAAVSGLGAGDGKAFEVALRAQDVSGDDARAVAKMLDGVLRRGNFGVTVADDLGRQRRADHVVAWTDNQHGRYLLEDSRSMDGRVWTTIAPADNRRLAGQLERLLASTA